MSLENLNEVMPGISQSRHISNSPESDVIIEIDISLVTFGPIGLTDQQISKMIAYKWISLPIIESASATSIIINNGNINCSICLQHISNGSLVRQLKCHHIFHVKCIDKWLKINGTCPIDRISMLNSFI